MLGAPVHLFVLSHLAVASAPGDGGSEFEDGTIDA
jgi:hypothetical protein